MGASIDDIKEETTNDKVKDYFFDGILVSSDVHGLEISNIILSLGYDKDKIINFFESI